jgi:quinol monooxygenase YgiN
MSDKQVGEIQGVARFTFHEGKVEEFKSLCAEFIDIVRAKDTGKLQFEIYLSDDDSECVIYERYRDSDAVIDYGAYVGEIMQAIFATGSGSSALLGEPSAELTAERRAHRDDGRRSRHGLQALPVHVEPGSSGPSCPCRAGVSAISSRACRRSQCGPTRPPATVRAGSG